LTPCDIPDRFHEISLATHKADSVRAGVLARYGGLWLDKTVFVFKPLDQLWDPILNGDSHIYACTDTDRAPWSYTEIYFLLARPKDQAMELWRDQIRLVMDGRTSTDGIKDHQYFKSMDFTGIDANPKLAELTDYLALSNVMWYTMATKNKWLKDDMLFKWKMYHTFKECMSFSATVGYDARVLLQSPDDVKWHKFEALDFSFTKITGVTNFVEAFNKHYGDGDVPIDRVLADNTYLSRLLAKATVVGVP
jgi:hypothetical protein